MKNCEGFSRRDCIKLGLGAVFGGGLAHALRLRAAAAPADAASTGASLPIQARSCILVWMDGGPTHYETFDPKPLASASLGQVHRARLRGGRQVVVKVQRPGIRRQIAEDFEVLHRGQVRVVGGELDERPHLLHDADEVVPDVRPEERDAAEEAGWTVADGVLTGRCPRSHLFSPRGDLADLEVRASLRIGDGGNSGLYVRAQPAAGWPPGYEAQVNSSFEDPQKTGSLYGLAPLLTQLVGPDTWFDYSVVCRDEPAGTHVTIRVNGVIVNDFVDTERRHASGHVILQQHHEGSVVEIGGLEVREL